MYIIDHSANIWWTEITCNTQLCSNERSIYIYIYIYIYMQQNVRLCVCVQASTQALAVCI